MCTNIMIRTQVHGAAKGVDGWFTVDTANVSFDHPFHAPFDHTLNIDFTNERTGNPTRIAVELSASSARALIEAIAAALAQGEMETGGS